MNILFLTHEGLLTGSTHSISYLARGLADRGHQIYVGCHADSLLYSMLEPTNVHCIAMKFKAKVDWQNIKQIRQVVEQYDIELINAQSSLDRYSSVFARWIYKLDVKVVHTRRQISLSIGGYFKNLIYHKGTDKIVAVSEGVKDSIVKLGIPAAHIKVIHNGTPPEKYDVVDPAIVQRLRNELNISEGDIVLGCCSRLKHQIQIIQALAYLKKPVKVIFVGIGPEERFLKLLEQNKIAHAVHFLGTAVPNQLALNYMKLFTIGILPSTTEGLSQSLLEAMALGVPVIATAYAGNLDLIQDGKNGLLFEHENVKQLAEKISLLIEQPKLRKQLGEAGQQTALVDFSIQRTVENYEQFFSELINRS